MHSCLICNELEIPLQIVARFGFLWLCAYGMLLSASLRMIFVRTFVATTRERLDWPRLKRALRRCGAKAIGSCSRKHVAPELRPVSRSALIAVMPSKYHEVSFDIPEAVDRGTVTARPSRRAHFTRRTIAPSATAWRLRERYRDYQCPFAGARARPSGPIIPWRRTAARMLTGALKAKNDRPISRNRLVRGPSPYMTGIACDAAEPNLPAPALIEDRDHDPCLSLPQLRLHGRIAFDPLCSYTARTVAILVSSVCP